MPVEKSSTEASQPQAKSEPPIPDVSFVKPALCGSHTNSYLTQDKDSNILITYVCKKEFQDNGHIRSGKYFLSLSPNLTEVAKKSGLLIYLILMAMTYPCAATYQWCIPSVPMLRYKSSNIFNISPMKIKY